MGFDLPPAFWLLWWGILGLVVGSFLNVAIHRLPLEGQSLRNPRRSRCPSCGHVISWRENIPILSWVIQLGRCRSCAWRIPIRYPIVELLTAGLFVLILAQAPDGAPGLVLVRSLVVSGLVVATFVDLAHFEIPDEVSIGGIVLAPLCALLVPDLHAGTWIARELAEGGPVGPFEALCAALAGILVGGGILVAIGSLGRRIYGREAMGFGDVKLLAAGGGFVGPGGALVALLLGALLASAVGISNLVRFLCLSRARARRRGAGRPFSRSIRSARIAGRYIPFGPYLGIGIGIALLAWSDVARLLGALLG